jgi:hypothetical protein
MHKPSVEKLLYAILFPNPVPDRDPVSLQGHITKNIIPEVRAETLRFFGPNVCLESQYPGLDYSQKGHRLRLGQFPHHRRLFRAFDYLRLTEKEVYDICRWEGTKSARDRYEKDAGQPIKDTTWEGVRPYPPKPMPTSIVPNLYASVEASIAASLSILHELEVGTSPDESDLEDTDDGEDHDEEDEAQDSEDDPVNQSVGVELNQRLLAATEARARGEEVPLDADWEQWLKEAAERGFAEAAPPGDSPIWGQVVPDAFRYGAGQPVPPHIGVMQAQMPPPPTYPTGALPANNTASFSSHPAGSVA